MLKLTKQIVSLEFVFMMSLMITRNFAFSNINLQNNISTQKSIQTAFYKPYPSNSALNMVWWLGGSESASSKTDESCEVVPVRIDKTSPNSRRIGGEISVDAPIQDVWAILTDYDNLSTHVPNLVESRRVTGITRGTRNTKARESVQGDGHYKCRLFQRGAQKIVGFEFGASVTLDMTEKIVLASATEDNASSQAQERKIFFKCVESQFFSEFDGEWKVRSDPNNADITTVSYVVDVRPKGPVPVVALEWRIREDVPTNLLAVKKASIESGLEGVLALRASQQGGAVSRALAKVERTNERGRRTGAARLALRDGRNRVRNIMDRLPQQTNSSRMQPIPVPVPVSAQWEDNETMAAYLKK